MTTERKKSDLNQCSWGLPAPKPPATVYTQVKVNYLKEDRKHLRKDGEPNFNSRRTIPRKNIWRPQIG